MQTPIDSSVRPRREAQPCHPSVGHCAGATARQIAFAGGSFTNEPPIDVGALKMRLYATTIILLLSCFTTSEGANILLSSPTQLRPGKQSLHAVAPLNLRGGGMKGLTQWLDDDFPASLVPSEKSICPNGTIRPNPCIPHLGFRCESVW